jgi:hypothetical protein
VGNNASVIAPNNSSMYGSLLTVPQSQGCSPKVLPAKQHKSSLSVQCKQESEGSISVNEFPNRLESETNSLNVSNQSVAVADLLPGFVGVNDVLTFRPNSRPAEQFGSENRPPHFQNSFVAPLESGWTSGTGRTDLMTTDISKANLQSPRRKDLQTYTSQNVAQMQRSNGSRDASNMNWAGIGHSGLEEPLTLPGCSSWVSGAVEPGLQSQTVNFTELLNGDGDDLDTRSKQMTNCGVRRRRTSSSHEKIFACQYENCSKSFYRKDHLTRHQRQKHGKPFGIDAQVTYYCHDISCGKSFFKISTLHRHMTEAHHMVNEFS